MKNKTKNKIVASFLAMAFGWFLLMALLIIQVIGTLNAKIMVSEIVLTVMISALIVLVAWVVVCLPVYLLVPSGSKIYAWYIGGPIGAAVGFGVGSMIGVAGLAMIVGGAAGSVGRLLVEDDDYEEVKI